MGRYTGGPRTDLAVVSVEYGKRYRFRLVGMSCDAIFLLSVDEHNLTVIEADGMLTEPLTGRFSSNSTWPTLFCYIKRQPTGRKLLDTSITKHLECFL